MDQYSEPQDQQKTMDRLLCGELHRLSNHWVKSATFCRSIATLKLVHNVLDYEDVLLQVTQMKCAGTCTVPVAINTPTDDYTTSNRETRTLNQYIDYVNEDVEATVTLSNKVYMKDWHFDRCTSKPSSAEYSISPYFTDDWVQECYDDLRDASPFNGDDYHFVYIGVKDSWTPFHADVLGTHSWSANICGQKLWYFVPPGQEHRFMDQHGNLIGDIRTRSSIFDECRCLTVIQPSGFTMFVPSNWHHQETSISINANWLNASNMENLVEYVTQRFVKCLHEIAHCAESAGHEFVNEQAMMMLKCDSAMSFGDILMLIEHILEKRKNKKLCKEAAENDVIYLKKSANSVRECLSRECVSTGSTVALIEKCDQLLCLLQ